MPVRRSLASRSSAPQPAHSAIITSLSGKIRWRRPRALTLSRSWSIRRLHRLADRAPAASFPVRWDICKPSEPLSPTDVEVRLTVFSAQPGQAPCVVEVRSRSSRRVSRSRLSREFGPIASGLAGSQCRPGEHGDQLRWPRSGPTSKSSVTPGWEPAPAGRSSATRCPTRPVSLAIRLPARGRNSGKLTTTVRLQQAAIATGYIDLTSSWILNKFCPLPGLCPPHFAPSTGMS